jgi:predicted MPP superfamily phosphohydrolase
MMFFRDSKQIPTSLGHALYHIGSGWLIFVLYMVVFLACTDLIKVFNHSFRYGFQIALLLTTCLLLYGYINYQHTKKQVINLVFNKPLLDGNRLKIVAISDLHLGFGSNINRLRKDIDQINAEKPDLILIAGDLIDNSIVPVIEQRLDKELNRLHARLGIYMTPGNHEYISGFDACRDFLQSTSIQLLRDSMMTLPCGLQIIGRDDYNNRNRLPASNWANLVDASKPIVIVDHQPQRLHEAQQIKADLQISGHTHNGQVIPIKFLTNYLFELSYGYQKKDQTHYYVTSGLALWGPPLRIGSECEIVVFDCIFGGIGR